MPATATPKLTPIKVGPWRGRKSSTTRDLVPPDYIYTGQDALFVPNSELEGRKGVGHWRRRAGQSILFDTLPSASGIGLLPAKWGAHARWMRPFKSDSISDHQDTVICLVTKEDLDDDTLIDDGRFSNIYIRDQVTGAHYTLGSEYSTTTYPVPGTAQAYKYIPLWYESGDGGITRGVTEFDRRFLVGGSRRFLKANRQHYFPSRYGTPSRWEGRFTPTAALTQTATPDGYDPNFAGPGGEWAAVGGPVTLWQCVDDSGADTAGTDYASLTPSSGTGSFYCSLSTVTDPGVNTGFVLKLTLRSNHAATNSHLLVEVSNRAAATWMTAKSYGSPTDTTGTTTQGLVTGSFVEYTIAISAAEAANATFGNHWTVTFSFSGAPGASGSWDIAAVKLTLGSTATSDVDRLIPSGPIPPTWPGKLTTGTAVSGATASQRIFPNADRVDATWVPSTGTDLFAAIDDTTTTDYISTIIKNSEGVVDLGDVSGVPQAGDQVVFTVAAGIFGVLAAGSLTIQISEITGAIPAPQRAFRIVGLPLNSYTSFSITMTEDQVASVVDWSQLIIGFNFTAGGGEVRVAYAYMDWTPGAAEGGWKGSKRFFHSIAYVFEDGSTWMPVVPRLPSTDNALGVGFFTVDINNPEINFDKITWTLPKCPHGVVAMRLLRGLSIDATLDDNRLLVPYDMREIATVPAGTDTYDDFAADDSSLEDDPSQKVIHFKHSMPPRTRYIAGGEQRVAVMYGGLSPAAIELAPIGVTADYDLNFEDDVASIYGATYASYMRVSIDGSGSGQLELTKSDGATLVATKTYSFTSLPTLQRLVDSINATTCAADGLQWRAQLAPGVTGNEITNDVLTPHKRIVSNSVVTNTLTALTNPAGGLSKVPIGARISKTGVTAGTYVTEIVSDVELTMSAPATSTSTSDATFYADTGDNPTAAETDKGWQRAIANSLPPFLYFNATYLNGTFPVDKARIWLTAASPFQTRSAANNFTTLEEHTYVPPGDPGNGVGIASPERGFVVLWEHMRGYISNEAGGQSSTGEDQDFVVRIANSHQGCCAWDSIDSGNGFVTFAAADGIFAAQLLGTEYREMKLTDDTWRQFPVARGDFSFEMPLCQAATAMDDDTGKLSVRVVRNWIWVNYRTTGTHPNRQVVMDFSAGVDSYGLRSLMAEDGRPWPWSAPFVRSVTSLCEVVRSNGSHIYAWNEENGGSTGDGRIDELETGDTDNSVAISGSIESGWVEPGHDERVSVQEGTFCHHTPTGATTFFDIYRSRLNDGPYSLTLTVSGSTDVTDEPKGFTQAARTSTDAFRWAWRQTGGAAAELRPSELRLLLTHKIK